MKQRGLTFVTVLVFLAGAGAIFWIITYGPAYWDNTEVNRVIRQAANMCYRDKNDDDIKRFILLEVGRIFPPSADQPRDQPWSIDLDPQDVRVERSDTPAVVNVWITYHRTINLPIVGGQRELTFVDHAEQDLTPVKW